MTYEVLETTNPIPTKVRMDGWTYDIIYTIPTPPGTWETVSFQDGVLIREDEALYQVFWRRRQRVLKPPAKRILWEVPTDYWGVPTGRWVTYIGRKIRKYIRHA